MNYNIRPCSEEDTTYIWEKESEAFHALLPSADYAEPEQLVFKLCDADGDIIGGCVLGIDLLKTAELERLWVDDRYRRRGIASALICTAELAAKKNGCRIILNAYCFDFQAAKPLFEKLGYHCIGTIHNWPKGHECYTLFKRLDHTSADSLSTEAVNASFAIEAGSEADGAFITERLEAFNNSFVSRSHSYLDLDKKITDESGRVIAGCIAGVSGWDAAYLDAIWVDDSFCDRDLVAALLAAVEQEARENGAYIVFATVAEPQAALFLRQGYTTDIVYEGNPKFFVMQKLI